ncbi:MAG: hypothetical protein QF464_24340, partial [Myxococcota bacterium]|nr:hypothetical protein [Myxococcota bacterium]
LTVTVGAPDSGSHVLGAGVDVFMTPGMKLHKGATVRIGPDARVEPTKVVRMPDGTGVRVSK